MMIKRGLLNRLISHLKAKEISLIVGARQVGKTTVMKELLNLLKKNGEKTVFLNLDFESDKKFFTNQELLLNKLELEIGKSGYVFIDEIQRKENAGLFLKGIFDLTLPYKFIVSGSGSLELKEKIQESLTGRKRIFEMFPVTFKEFVNYSTNYKYENQLDSFFELEKDKTEILLHKYLSYGGYPRIVTEENIIEKKALINEIFRSYIEKDIVSLLNIDMPDSFSQMIRILAGQTGRLLNYSQLASAIGFSTATLKKYLWYAEKTFIVNTLHPYYSNSVKELTKSKTVYFYDHGLRNFSNNSFKMLESHNELGFVFQNFVKNLLEQNIGEKSWRLNFWRTTDKAEVDFVIDKGDELIPVEVKYSIRNDMSIKRSLRSFVEKYSPGKALVINRNYSGTFKLDKTEIIFLPYYKLLTTDQLE
ncbi:MAG: ATP-binding protein [Melioribacteraceae bacterium]|nr:ATP-binding protein [Melioribacteraceae bacterium]